MGVEGAAIGSASAISKVAISNGYCIIIKTNITVGFIKIARGVGNLSPSTADQLIIHD